MGWGLIFYPGNWPIIAPLHVPVEYNGMLMSIADIQGYNYVRTGTPEYIRMVEKGTLRTFGKDVAPVSAFFSAFMSHSDLLHVAFCRPLVRHRPLHQGSPKRDPTDTRKATTHRLGAS
jgi:methane monooxygenase/ammonia monooxygenase subunit A